MLCGQSNLEYPDEGSEDEGPNSYFSVYLWFRRGGVHTELDDRYIAGFQVKPKPTSIAARTARTFCRHYRLKDQFTCAFDFMNERDALTLTCEFKKMMNHFCHLAVTRTGWPDFTAQDHRDYVPTMAWRYLIYRQNLDDHVRLRVNQVLDAYPTQSWCHQRPGLWL